MLLDVGEDLDEFEIVRCLGSGAAGDVYLALAKKSSNRIIAGRRYALKIYNEWVLSQSNQAERLKRELEASQRTKHPSIVTIHDLRIDSGSPRKSYLIMEVVNGVSLDRFVQQDSPLEMGTIEAIFSQLADGVQALHGEHIIHRDIKPQNIMIDLNNKLTLMDLGVAKFELEKTITPSNQFLGTIRYSAPEILFGERYDARVDLYSMGAILYLLLMGTEPYEYAHMFSELIVRKKEDFHGCLVFPASEEPESLRLKVLKQLVSDLTRPIDHPYRARIKSAAEVRDILEDPKIELSDWWISAAIDTNPKHLEILKSLLIKYLDPRMPADRTERLQVLSHDLKVSFLLGYLKKYLPDVETEEGRKQLEELRKLEEEDYWDTDLTA